MRRRTFAAGALALASAPVAVRAQAPRLKRVALVSQGRSVTEMKEDGLPWLRAFHAELKRLGFVEGREVAISYWSGAGRSDFDGLAREVVATAPDVILAVGTPAAVDLARQTRTIPIVFFGADPEPFGLVTNFARPGGNVTGFTADAGIEITTKSFQFLIELAKDAKRVAHLGPAPNLAVERPEIERAASLFGVTVLQIPIEEPVSEPAYRRAFEQVAASGARAVFVSTGSQNGAHAQLIATLALERRLASISRDPQYAQYGGLLTYAASWIVQFKGAAGYVARILKGEKPGDLPVQQPREFDLTVNKKTADALGLQIPEHLLVFAAEVIE